MDVKNSIEKFMLDMNLSFQEIAENTWMIEDEFTHIDNIVVQLSEPILLFRVKLMEIPVQNTENFFKKLLELNSSDLVHGAYALEGNNVVIVDTLETDNINANEFQATIDSITMALTQHYELLSNYFDK